MCFISGYQFICDTGHWGGQLQNTKYLLLAVLPDWAIFWTLGHFLKPLAAINLPRSRTFVGNFSKDVKIYHFYCEIIFGKLLLTFGDFFLVTLTVGLGLGWAK